MEPAPAPLRPAMHFLSTLLLSLTLLCLGAPASAQPPQDLDAEVIHEIGTDAIKVRALDDQGEYIAGYAFTGIEDHYYGGHVLAGTYDRANSTYECWHPDGWRNVVVQWKSGLRVTVFGDKGEILWERLQPELSTEVSETGQTLFEYENGLATFYHESGNLAAEIRLCPSIWADWGHPLDRDVLIAVLNNSLGDTESADAEADDITQQWVDYYAERKEAFCRRSLRSFRKGLSHADPFVRQESANALYDLAPFSGKAAKDLADALDDESLFVRSAAARALAALESHAAPAVPKLIVTVLNDEVDLDTRIAAAVALKRVGPSARAAVPEFVEWMEGQIVDPRLACSVVDVFGELGEGAAASRKILIILTGSGDSTLSVRARLALWRVDPTRDPVPYLIRALDGDAERSEAIRALAEMGPAAERAGDALEELLHETYDSGTKGMMSSYQLAGALREVRPDSQALATWQVGGENPYRDRLRWHTLVAYCMVSETPRAVKNAFNELWDGADSSNTAIEYHTTLAAIGPHNEAAVPALLYLLRDNQILLREWAALALSRIGKPALPQLEESLQSEHYLVRWTAPVALSHIGAPAVPVLTRALQLDEEMVLVNCIMALGRIGPDAEMAVGQLESMLESGAPDLRIPIQEALARIQRQG